MLRSRLWMAGHYGASITAMLVTMDSRQGSETGVWWIQLILCGMLHGHKERRTVQWWPTVLMDEHSNVRRGEMRSLTAPGLFRDKVDFNGVSVHPRWWHISDPGSVFGMVRNVGQVNNKSSLQVEVSDKSDGASSIVDGVLVWFFYSQ